MRLIGAATSPHPAAIAGAHLHMALVAPTVAIRHLRELCTTANVKVYFWLRETSEAASAAASFEGFDVLGM